MDDIDRMKRYEIARREGMIKSYKAAQQYIKKELARNQDTIDRLEQEIVDLKTKKQELPL